MNEPALTHVLTAADTEKSAVWPMAVVLATTFWLLLGNLAQSQELVNPRRLADGPSGQIVVADRLGSIVGVDRETLEARWALPLPDEGAPFGIATLNRLLFVGNTVTGNVEVYHLSGPAREGIRMRWLYNLGHTAPGDPGLFQNPIDIAVDRRARLVFVLDGQSKLISVFDVKGAPVSSFAPADAAGNVLSPVSIALDPARQEILVGDYGDPSGFFRASRAARILVLDYSGTAQFEISGNGSTHSSTTFSRVQGLAATDDGRIIVSDPLASRVFMLERDSGETLAEIGSEGMGPGLLRLPLDLLLDPKSGDLFVSNNQGARKVEVFRGAGR